MDDVEQDGGGYGKPPKEHQWKAGQSGNPKGRKKAEPARERQLVEYLAIELAEEIELPGSNEKITVGRFLAKRLLHASIKGEPKDMMSIFKLAMSASLPLKKDLDADDHAEDGLLTEEQRRLMQSMLDYDGKASGKKRSKS
jgi:hypothetical protein